MSKTALLASSATARVRRRNTIVLIALMAIVTAVLSLGMWHAIREIEATGASNAPTPEAII